VIPDVPLLRGILLLQSAAQWLEEEKPKQLVQMSTVIAFA